MWGALRDISHVVLELIGYKFGFINIYTLMLYHAVGGFTIPQACYTQIKVTAIRLDSYDDYR